MFEEALRLLAEMCTGFTLRCETTYHGRPHECTREQTHTQTQMHTQTHTHKY